MSSSSVFEISGNNLPELTTTSTSREYFEYFRIMVSRKMNTFVGSDPAVYGYNRAIEELKEELDRLEYKIDDNVSREKNFNEANRFFSV